jgi:hypothetical protein
MNKESSAGFAIGTSDELLIKENALERFGPKWGEPEDRERAVQGGWVDAEGEITTKGWDLLNDDINRIEKNSVSWLDKKFHGARSEGHGDYELVGTFWFDPHNPEQANLVYLAANNGAQERIDMVDWSYGDFTTAFDGVSWFGGLVLDGSITFFDVHTEDMEIIEATLERERQREKKTKTRRTQTREEVQRRPTMMRERMFIVTTAHDITTYLRNFRGDIAIAGSDIWKRATEALRAADHPPWGTDWKEWLDLPSTQRMIDDVARETSPRTRPLPRRPAIPPARPMQRRRR